MSLLAPGPTSYGVVVNFVCKVLLSALSVMPKLRPPKCMTNFRNYRVAILCGKSLVIIMVLRFGVTRLS